MSNEKNNQATGFYLLSDYADQDDLIPIKTTKLSAGYDFKAAEDVTIPVFHVGLKPTLVPTGVKCKLDDAQVLLCFNRSSNPLKRGLVIANGVGVVDADYFGNDTNEGAIYAMFWNMGDKPYQIHKGDRIMQGVIMNYENLAKASVAGLTRTGGFGSTGVKNDKK